MGVVRIGYRRAQLRLWACHPLMGILKGDHLLAQHAH